MKFKLPFTLSLVALLGMSTLAANTRMDGEFLHEVTSEFATPHQEWAATFQEGTIKALFITPRRFGAREVVELAQRIDLDYETIVAANFSNLSVDSVYEAGVLGTSAFEKNTEVLKKVRDSYDVIVLANVTFSALSAEAQYHILKQVSEGAGLVIVYRQNFPFPKVMQNPVDDWQQILAMVDTKALPGVAATMATDKLLQTYQFGKGRIAVLPYPAPQTRLGLTSYEKYSVHGWRAKYENSLALAGRTIQWAAGHNISASIQPNIENDTLKLSTNALSSGAAWLRIRNIKDDIIWQKEISLGENPEHELALSDLPAGEYYLDIRWGTDSKVAGFGVFHFERAFIGGSVAVQTNKNSYEQGENVTVEISLEKPLEQDTEVLITIKDLPAQNLWKQQIVKLPQGTQSVSASFQDIHIPTVAGLIEAQILADKKLLAETSRITYFPRREIELFPTILWENLPNELSEMYAAQLDQSVHDAAALSHPGNEGEAGKLSALFNQRFIPYMTRIGLGAGENGETLSNFWLGMKKEDVEKATKGDGSIHNSAVRDFWKKNIEERIKGLPEVGPMIYTLGDENYFSYEAGYSEADNAAFPKFLQKLYGDIATLNKEWGTSHTDFEAIGHPTPTEMRDQELYPLWYAHRRFMEEQYAETHHYLAEVIKEIDPKALVGAEGSVPGNIELTTSKLDFWGPYKNIVGDELLRSVASEKLRTIWWGYGNEFLAYPLWSPLLRGSINGNSWYSSSIEAISGLMSSDFSLAEYYKNERKPFVDALNQGVAQALISTPLKPHGIAVLWSHASYSASFMDDRFLSPQDSNISLINYLYETGLNFDLLTSSRIEEGALENYKILYLFGATALSDKETNAVKQFVENGGVVVADINPGILNASCGPREKSSLAEVFGTDRLKGKAPLRMKKVSVDTQVRDVEISFTAAKAYQSSEAPVFSVNEFGKGLAILLNFNLSSAANTTDGSLDDLLLPLLKLADISPEIKVDGISKERLLLKIRENEENQVIGILPERSNIGKTATLTLPASGWVYEANKGLIGETDTIKTTLDIPFKVFTVFKEKQEAPVFEVKDPTLKPGEITTLDLSQLSKQGVYRLEVAPADKLPIQRFTKVFTGDAGDQHATLRFALSDAPGKYQVSIHDARTGLTTQQTVELSEDSTSTASVTSVEN